MPLLDYFRSNKKQNTATVARDRLQIIVAHERSTRHGQPDYLPQLERDILEVIRKYVEIGNEQVSVKLEQRDEDLSVLELNVMLPE